VIELNDLVIGSQGKIISQMQTQFKGVGTDTRKDLTDQIFVALKGPTFDAHKFLSEAKKKGAAALLVHDLSQASADFKNSVTIVEVKDTLLGLQNLATYWRRKNRAKIISVTGSNGKTTTKEFSAAVIGAHRSTVFNRGSFNNHFGVPLSLLEILPEHKVAIIEMGMNHEGEIRDLCKIAEPDVALVTNVGRVHLEGLGSIENVAKAKDEIYHSRQHKLIRVFNLDNPYTLKMFDKYLVSTAREQVISFSSQDKNADVRLEVSASHIGGITIAGEIRGVRGEAKVAVFGAHNVYNLMGAAGLALSVGVTPQQIWQSLHLCSTPWGRNQKVKLHSGAEIIFDGYNANPESMNQLIANSLKIESSGKKIAVIGEMAEMGTAREKVHHELGRLVGEAKFDLIWFIGVSSEDFAEGLKEAHYAHEYLFSEKFDSKIAVKIKTSLGASDRVWIKGSRSMKLEQVVQALDPVDFGDKD